MKRKREDTSERKKKKKVPCLIPLGLAQPDESVLALDDLDAARIDECGNVLEMPKSKEPMHILTRSDAIHAHKTTVIRREDIEARALRCIGPWAENGPEEVARVRQHSAQTRILVEKLQDIGAAFILRDFIYFAEPLSWNYMNLTLFVDDHTATLFLCDDWALICRYDRAENVPLVGFSFMLPPPED